jgi:hypothetical protein
VFNFPLFGRRAPAVKVELKEAALKQVYVYEDENLKLEIPVPPLEVFLAFVRELDKLGAEGVDVESSVTTVARAFWLLHQRPLRKGFFRKRYVVPEVDEDAALTLLRVKVRRGDVAVKSLAPAMFGLLKYVTGG